MCIYNWEKKKKKSKQLRQILWIALPLREKTMFKSGFHFLTSQTVCVCVSVCLCVRVCVCVCVCARTRTCACSVTWSCSVLWTVAHQAPLSMEFSRLEYWSVMPFPPPGDLPNPGIKSTSPSSLALAGGFFTYLRNPLARLSDTDYLTFFKPHFHINGCSATQLIGLL